MRVRSVSWSRDGPLAGLALGPVSLAPGTVWSALFGHGDANAIAIVQTLRLPRIALGIVIAALLSGLIVVLPAVGRGTVRAGLLLLLWYGLRGLAAAALSRGRRRGLIAEYGMFVAAAVGAIAAGVLRG